MISTAHPPRQPALDPSGETARHLEVATVDADRSRADVRVTGIVDHEGAGLLEGILRAHLRAGRRDLRVDLAASRLDDTAADSLVGIRAEIERAGATLVLVHVDSLPA